VCLRISRKSSLKVSNSSATSSGVGQLPHSTLCTRPLKNASNGLVHPVWRRLIIWQVARKDRSRSSRFFTSRLAANCPRRALSSACQFSLDDVSTEAGILVVLFFFGAAARREVVAVFLGLVMKAPISFL
jgi:hypothetical protein